VTRPVGFVVVEYNQASGLAALSDDIAIYRRKGDAEEVRDDFRSLGASLGRGETYAIAEVVLVDEEGEPL
jgi:hypothetical protein